MSAYNNSKSGIDYKKHAKRFAKGFPWDTIEFYIGFVVLFATIGIIFIWIASMTQDISSVETVSKSNTNQLINAISLAMVTFSALPFVRAFVFVAVGAYYDRRGVNENE